jgi:hypothetical protein
VATIIVDLVAIVTLFAILGLAVSTARNDGSVNTPCCRFASVGCALVRIVARNGCSCATSSTAHVVVCAFIVVIAGRVVISEDTPCVGITRVICTDIGIVTDNVFSGLADAVAACAGAGTRITVVTGISIVNLDATDPRVAQVGSTDVAIVTVRR